MNDQQWHDVEHIGELAAGAYWLGKDRDPTQADRLGGSAYVRNNAEYVGVAAGQMTAGHLLWGFLAKLLLIPFWIGTFIAFMGVPFLLEPRHTDILTGQSVSSIPFGTVCLIELGCFILWVYLCCWRLTMKPILKWSAKKGPGITYADGYRGPLGNGETVYTNRPDVR
jgi:hypothetical protein